MTIALRGEPERIFRWASVTKPVTALAVLVAAEEGTLDLDEPAGPPGSTVRHLLAHASGLPFEGLTPIAPPAVRRIYSNAGFDVLGEHLAERAGMPFADYLERAVLQPLAMGAELRGRPGEGLRGSLDDLIRVAVEAQASVLVDHVPQEQKLLRHQPGPRLSRAAKTHRGLRLPARGGGGV